MAEFVGLSLYDFENYRDLYQHRLTCIRSNEEFIRKPRGRESLKVSLVNVFYILIQ